MLAPLGAQTDAPPQVSTSAVAAVKALGEQVVLQKYQVAIDRMYPQWKEKMAKGEGGMARLEAKLAGIGKTMAEQGVSLISFRPVGEPITYEVESGMEKVEENGRIIEKMIFRKWMLLIPTETKYRITKPRDGEESAKPIVITTTGFQVAISEKGKNDWTFIDGASISVPELRRMFFTLPDNMTLPPIKRKSSEAN